MKSSAIRTTFKTYERLKREQHIDTLFLKGKAFSVFPLRVLFLNTSKIEEEISPVRIGFSVPKKKFKKAVQRNRMKRLLREAWRLNKTSLYEAIPEKDQLHIFLILTSNSEQNFETIRTSLLKAIEQIKKQITANE